ncbi:efflux transporter outer membrane subunit [Novosphingobium sp.]|uniref:efflux transporter outer membrane subunit n=1 Tax=Novosphingobium sp. TaxID=1874826 RepID=UPI0038BAF4EC
MIRLSRFVSQLGATLLLAGCAGNPPLAPLKPPVAPNWQAANAAPRQQTGLAASAQQEGWWRAYGDPALDALVARALADNTDVAVALARVDQARAASRANGAARLPSGQVSGSLARAEQSLDSGLGRLTRYVPTLSRTQNEAVLSASLGWDLDLAGGLRKGQQAARADAVAAQAGLAAAQLAVAASVVESYLDYRAAQAQLALAQARVDQLSDRLRFAEARLAHQDGSARDRDDRAAERSAASAAVPLLRAQVDAARYGLAVLTGVTAQTPLPELAGAADIPQASDPAAGLPADLLRLRPDLVVAEAQVLAAHARVGAALGEYWPHVTLNGLIGWDTNSLGSFGADSARVTQGAIGLRWRLFDFARIDAEVAAAKGRERESLASYRGAVLKAGSQVESSFAALAARRAALQAQQDQLTAVSSALHRAEAALRVGEISQDQLRGATLAQIAAKAQVVEARAALAQAVLACHRALGG